MILTGDRRAFSNYSLCCPSYRVKLFLLHNFGFLMQNSFKALCCKHSFMHCTAFSHASLTLLVPYACNFALSPLPVLPLCVNSSQHFPAGRGEGIGGVCLFVGGGGGGCLYGGKVLLLLYSHCLF